MYPLCVCVHLYTDHKELSLLRSRSKVQWCLLSKRLRGSGFQVKGLGPGFVGYAISMQATNKGFGICYDVPLFITKREDTVGTQTLHTAILTENRRLIKRRQQEIGKLKFPEPKTMYVCMYVCMYVASQRLPEVTLSS